MSIFDPLHDPDDENGVDAWYDYREQEWHRGPIYPLAEKHGIDVEMLKSLEPTTQHIKGHLMASITRSDLGGIESDDHITEAERAALYERYTRLYNVNLDAPRPDGDGD